MRQVRKSKNDIDKLRKILDDPRDPNTRKIISSDEEHLQSLQKRLTRDMRRPIVSPPSVRSTKKPAPCAPTVVVYKREVKQPLEIKRTVPEALPEFTSAEEEKLPVFIEVPPLKDTNNSLEQPPLATEELYESKDLFEVEKTDAVAPEFLEVRPQVRITPARKDLQEFQEVSPRQEYPITKPQQKINDALPEWEPVVEEGKPGKPEEPLQSFTEVPRSDEPPIWAPIQEEKIPLEEPEQTPLEKQKRKQEEKLIKKQRREQKRDEKKARKLAAQQAKEALRKQKLEIKKQRLEEEQKMRQEASLVPEPETPEDYNDDDLSEEQLEQTAFEKQKEKEARQQAKKIELERKRREKEEKKRTKQQALLESKKQKEAKLKTSAPPSPEPTLLKSAVEAFKGMESIDEKTALLLYNHGYFSVDDLKKTTINDLTAIRGIKRKHAKQIKKELDKKEALKSENQPPSKSKKKAKKPIADEETEWTAYHVDEIQFVDSIPEYCTHGAFTLYKREIVRVGGKKTTIHFFSKEKPAFGETASLPEGYRIAINRKTGSAYLKKKR